MNENDFQVKLSELIGQIDQLPENERDALQKLAAESKSRHEKVRKTIADLQDSIDYLRLSIKYLVFDLEATRRENAHLRKLLEERTSDGCDEQGEE
jgi:predicted  nucleic acid-binding Zn-ribbon protein